MAKVFILTDKTFTAEVINSSAPVLVDFWASWCPPCKVVEPLLDKLAVQYAELVKVAKLQVDQNPKAASRFGIQGVPTFIVFKDGKPLDKKVGAQGERVLKGMIDLALDSRPL